MDKTIYSSSQHKMLQEKVQKISELIYEINEIIEPNKDISMHLLEVLDQLANICIKMRDKYT